MKTITLLLICLSLFAMRIQGQSYRNNPLFNEIKRVEIPSGMGLYNQIRENNSNINNKIYSVQLSDSLSRRRPGSGKNNFIYHYPRKRLYDDFRIAEATEIYPGAPRFYKKQNIMPVPYAKSFIIRRVPPGKYYLIIKDPITHRIIN